jgi:hypothetical protein
MARSTARDSLTATDVLGLLRGRYQVEDGWVLLEQIPPGNDPRGGYRKDRYADAIAFSTRRRREGAYEVAGFEVKVSRADWRRELADPGKSRALRRYCHRWWLVVSDASIVRPGELPAGWGLLVVDTVEYEPGKPLHKLRVATRAPFLQPDPPDHLFIARAMRRVVETYTHDGRLSAETDRGVHRVGAMARKLWERMGLTYHDPEVRDLERRVRAYVVGAHREARERMQRVLAELAEVAAEERGRE